MKAFWRMKVIGLTIMVLVLGCLGCVGSDAEATGVADPTGRPYTENLAEVVEVFDEIVFCTQEGAGVETIKSLRDRMVTVLNVLPTSIQQSELSSSEQARLTAAIKKASVACQKPGLENEAAFQTLCKDLQKPLESIKKSISATN